VWLFLTLTKYCSIVWLTNGSTVRNGVVLHKDIDIISFNQLVTCDCYQLVISRCTKRHRSNIQRSSIKIHAWLCWVICQRNVLNNAMLVYECLRGLASSHLTSVHCSRPLIATVRVPLSLWPSGHLAMFTRYGNADVHWEQTFCGHQSSCVKQCNLRCVLMCHKMTDGRRTERLGPIWDYYYYYYWY